MESVGLWKAKLTHHPGYKFELLKPNSQHPDTIPETGSESLISL